jgi:predicted transposase YbfD/YdcC
LTDETASAVTSLAPDQVSPAALLRLWRRHWTVENGLHWIRDVVFAEDAATTHTAHAPQALAVLRNLALSLLHRWRRHDITAARQYFASHPAALF